MAHLETFPDLILRLHSKLCSKATNKLKHGFVGGNRVEIENNVRITMEEFSCLFSDLETFPSM